MPKGIYPHQLRIKSKSTNEKRFWKKVKLDDLFDCWNWNSHLNSNGYGCLKINNKSILAHRFSYLIHNGSINDDLLVLHKCHNRACVNPAHLYQGNHLDNSNDKIRANRQVNVYGEKISLAKLTDKKVIEILSLLKDNISQAEIARKYNVKRSCIFNIKYNKTWKHIQR